MSVHMPSEPYGRMPDVAQGKDKVYVCRLGEWTPVFELSPVEAVEFGHQMLRAAGRVREEQRAGCVSPADRDAHLHLLDRARPPVKPPRPWQSDLAILVFGLGVVFLAMIVLQALGVWAWA